MIENMKQELVDLLAEIEGMDQSAEDFVGKVDQADALKGKIEQAVSAQEKLAGLTSFKPKTVQAVDVPALNVQVQEGFVSDPKKGFQTAGELMKLLAEQSTGTKKTFSLNANADDRLKHVCDISMTSGQGNTKADGLMIPAELDPTIHTLGLDASDDWFARINVKQTSSNSKEIRRSAATTNGGTVGMTVGRAAELATLTSSKQVFEKDAVKVDKLYVYSEVSEEDLEDIAWLESNMVATAPRLMDIAKGEEVLFGNGVGRALGFKNGGDSVTITRAGANAVAAADIVKMKARHLRSKNGGGSFWMVNHSVWEQLPLMTIGDQPIFVNDLSGRYDGFLLGLPVYTTEDCEDLGSIGDVYLVNPDAYCALEKMGGTKFASSMHVKFDSDAMAFRWTSRFGGIPLYNAPYTPRDKNSTTKDTLSNFCILGTA